MILLTAAVHIALSVCRMNMQKAKIMLNILAKEQEVAISNQPPESVNDYVYHI